MTRVAQEARDRKLDFPSRGLLLTGPLINAGMSFEKRNKKRMFFIRKKAVIFRNNIHTRSESSYERY